jgi:hypothetical protein
MRYELAHEHRCKDMKKQAKAKKNHKTIATQQ